MNLQSQPLCVAGKPISPPLLLAPMAGITHSAFRRLVSDFGGYGALCTEMLSGSAVCAENLAASPFTKRRAQEGPVIYQLRISSSEDIGRVIDRLSSLEPFGIDINLGCPAPEIRKCGGGVELFDDEARLGRALEAIRRRWKGLLTVKCRLGKRTPEWQKTFTGRLALFERCGIDGCTVHPRFSDEKLKRIARHDLFPWIAAQTKLPVIANGDIVGPTPAALGLLHPGPCRGLMIGRIAAVKPWIFCEFSGGRPAIDYREVWMRFFEYAMEDFRPEKAIGRIKEFSAYYARNFSFGHELFRRVQSSGDVDTLKKRALAFFSTNPALEKEPSVMGI